LLSIGRGHVQYADFAESPRGLTHRVAAAQQVAGKSFNISHSSTSRSNGPVIETATISGACTHLMVKLDHLPENHRELFSVRDDQGRELPHVVESFVMRDRLYAFVFVAPDDNVSSLQLTVVVHASRSVEIYMAPPRP
jgi:hypothetical protein